MMLNRVVGPMRQKPRKFFELSKDDTVRYGLVIHLKVGCIEQNENNLV
jgi:hypothetical protein